MTYQQLKFFQSRMGWSQEVKLLSQWFSELPMQYLCTKFRIIHNMSSPPKSSDNLSQFKLFVEKNPEMLTRLYTHSFSSKQGSPLKDIPQQQILSFTKELFGFNNQPYTEPEMQEIINSSLLKSFVEYEEKRPEELLHLESIVRLLEYCIETNRTFAVEYNPKERREERELGEAEAVEAEEKGQEEEKLSEQPDHTETAEIKQRTSTQTDKKAIDQSAVTKRLRVVFDFYCKQQQNIGTNATFDRISHECSVMNLGKFLIFCHAYGVTSQALNKYVLMEKFKKCAQGRKQIGMDKFSELINSLTEVDPELVTRVNLDSDKTFKQKLKLLNIPFSTKGRKDDQHRSSLPPSARKPTSHSGKTSQQLMQYLSARKKEKEDRSRHVSTPIPPTPPKRFEPKRKHPLHQQSSYSKIEQPSHRNSSPAQRSSSRDLKELGLDRLIIMQETDDQWLNEYKIQNNLESLKAQPTATKINTSRTMIEHNKNQEIVKDIRKRINEIQRSENVRESLQRAKLNTMNQQQQRRVIYMKNR